MIGILQLKATLLPRLWVCRVAKTSQNIDSLLMGGSKTYQDIKSLFVISSGTFQRYLCLLTYFDIFLVLYIYVQLLMYVCIYI